MRSYFFKYNEKNVTANLLKSKLQRLLEQNLLKYHKFKQIINFMKNVSNLSK